MACGLGYRAEAAISPQIRARQQAQVQQALQALNLRALACLGQQRQAWRAGEMAPWQGHNVGAQQTPNKKKPANLLTGLPAVHFGRREWTRTIDPHHVKVVL